MALGNEHITRSDHLHLPDHTAHAETAADRVLAVQHRSSAVAAGDLHADHHAVLRALIDHLMPVNDGVSVHTEIVVRYIDYLVANESAGPEVPLTLSETYRSGCELVQEHACRAYGSRVQAMPATERDRLVWDMLEGSMDGFDRFSPAYFFHTLRRHIADAMQTGMIVPN